MRQPLVHRRHRVPVMVRRARHAPVATLDRPTRSPIVFDGGTIEKRLRPFTAHLIQAPALTVPFVAPLANKLPGVEMCAALAVVVYSLSVSEKRAVPAVHQWERSKG